MHCLTLLCFDPDVSYANIPEDAKGVHRMVYDLGKIVEPKGLGWGICVVQIISIRDWNIRTGIARDEITHGHLSYALLGE